mgnify:CR=1 FL=1
MSIDTSSPEARLADGNLTLMQVVEEDTWYKNLSCNILQEAALQGVRMGLIKRRGGIWRPLGAGLRSDLKSSSLQDRILKKWRQISLTLLAVQNDTRFDNNKNSFCQTSKIFDLVLGKQS